MSNQVLYITTKGAEGQQRFTEPLRLDPQYEWEVGLKFLSFYNSIQNITTDNNLFAYEISGTAKSVSIEPGAYEISQISDALNLLLIAAGDSAEDDPLVVIEPAITNFKSAIKVRSADASALTIDFTAAGTLRDILGFNSQLLNGSTRYESDNAADIKGDTDSLRITTDITSGAFSNGDGGNTINEAQVLYQTGRRVPVGFNQIERIDSPIFLKVNQKNIYSIVMRMTNQKGDAVPITDKELIIYTLLIRRANKGMVSTFMEKLSSFMK